MEDSIGENQRDNAKLDFPITEYGKLSNITKSCASVNPNLPII